MKKQFRLFRRRKSVFYVFDNNTGRFKSLRTKNRAEAEKLVQAYNDTVNQPVFNLALARVYMAGTDPKLLTRTWQEVMEHIVQRRGGETRRRWAVAILDGNFDCIRNLKVVETRPEHFDKALADGKPSTNVYLRRIHNYAMGMDWLLKSVLPKLLWPKPQFKKKRGITLDEHLRIIEAESAAARRNKGSRNSEKPHYNERRDFYELLWHTGTSQSDAAFLIAENINWQQHTIAYSRRKLATHSSSNVKPALLRFGEGLAAVLARRPQSGPLFPYLRTVRPSDRATEFKQRCQGLGIEGISLHCYRYGWAERALKCAYPERFAQQALGHNSKAVHHAYSQAAEVVVPSLEDWEAHWSKTQTMPEKPKVTLLPSPPQEPRP